MIEYGGMIIFLLCIVIPTTLSIIIIRISNKSKEYWLDSNLLVGISMLVASMYLFFMSMVLFGFIYTLLVDVMINLIK